MSQRMPIEEGIDHSMSLMREGYMYISNRCHSFQSTIFQTRLLGQKTICMRGKDAAGLFYNPHKFKRKNAAPNRAIQTLFGKNSVQTLDGQWHKRRKEMLMSVMSKDMIQKLTDIIKINWKQAIKKWEQKDKIIFYEEVQEIMCKSACNWVGLLIETGNVNQLTKDLSAMFESAGAVGPNHWSGRHSRNRVEKWIETVVEDIRNEKIYPPKNSPLYQFTQHQDVLGNLLDKETVAVEVINILRPIVAISIYVNFLMLAIHHFPKEREKLNSGDETYKHRFIQEVRRFYPFFPFAIAKVKDDFIWNDYLFKKNTLALLDLYGTNHDPEIWDNPDLFRPDRFINWQENPFNFIPQGGGDHFAGHRCAGEWITTQVMITSLDCILNQMQYVIPDQDLSFSMVSMPSIPRSKIVLKEVKQKL